MQMTDVVAPTLKELKTRECTPAELQAALVKLIEMHNGTVADINAMISDGRIRSKREAIMNTPYGL
jgi:hypothetical protein